MVSQNEYALIDKKSKYQSLCTSGIDGCIALLAYSPKRERKFLTHLDRTSHIDEAISLVLNLLEEDRDLKITLVNRHGLVSLKNQTLENLKKKLSEQNISFNLLSTKTGTVVLGPLGKIRTDLVSLSTKDKKKYFLALPKLGFGYDILKDLEIHRSVVFKTQWDITNLNAIIDEPKPLHWLITTEDSLNTDPEKLNPKLISLIEEIVEDFKNQHCDPEAQPKIAHTIVFDKLWQAFGQSKIDQIVIDNQMVVKDYIESLSKLSLSEEELSRSIKYANQQFDEQIPPMIQAQKDQFQYHSTMILSYLSELKKLKARHKPLDSDGEPTADFDFYDRICAPK